MRGRHFFVMMAALVIACQPEAPEQPVGRSVEALEFDRTWYADFDWEDWFLNHDGWCWWIDAVHPAESCEAEAYSFYAAVCGHFCGLICGGHRVTRPISYRCEPCTPGGNVDDDPCWFMRCGCGPEAARRDPGPGYDVPDHPDGGPIIVEPPDGGPIIVDPPTRSRPTIWTCTWVHEPDFSAPFVMEEYPAHVRWVCAYSETEARVLCSEPLLTRQEEAGGITHRLLSVTDTGEECDTAGVVLGDAEIRITQEGEFLQRAR